MALSHERVAVRLLLSGRRRSGSARPTRCTTPISPTPTRPRRGPASSRWHNLSDPLSQTVGILVFGDDRGRDPQLAVGHCSSRWSASRSRCRSFTIHEPEKGANESQPHPQGVGDGHRTPSRSTPRVLLGSAVTRLLRIRSLYYELVAVAILGFAGTGIPLFGSLYFEQVWHQDTAHRSEIYSIIGLSAFLGLPVACLVGDRSSGGRRSARSSSPASASPSTAACSRCRSTCRSSGWWCMLQFLANVGGRAAVHLASSRPWPPPPRPRCGPSASACSACTRSSSAASPAASCSAPSATRGRRDHRARR